jgi:hypothetical protein
MLLRAQWHANFGFVHVFKHREVARVREKSIDLTREFREPPASMDNRRLRISANGSIRLHA